MEQVTYTQPPIWVYVFCRIRALGPLPNPWGPPCRGAPEGRGSIPGGRWGWGDNNVETDPSVRPDKEKRLSGMSRGKGRKRVGQGRRSDLTGKREEVGDLGRAGLSGRGSEEGVLQKGKRTYLFNNSRDKCRDSTTPSGLRKVDLPSEVRCGSRAVRLGN